MFLMAVSALPPEDEEFFLELYKKYYPYGKNNWTSMLANAHNTQHCQFPPSGSCCCTVFLSFVAGCPHFVSWPGRSFIICGMEAIHLSRFRKI